MPVFDVGQVRQNSNNLFEFQTGQTLIVMNNSHEFDGGAAEATERETGDRQPSAKK